MNVISSLKYKFIDTTSPFIGFFSGIFWEAKKVLYYHRTFEEYTNLKQEVSILKSRFMDQEEVFLENSRLKRLLGLKRKLVYSSVVANVIGREPSSWNSSMIIDRGREDGLKQGMPVVNAFGVIGKIAEISESSSKVILLTDAQFSVAGLVKRTRDNGLVSGTLKGKCQLTYINPDSDIQIGDQVITSKLSSSFPENLFIGDIKEIDKQDTFYKYFIEPAASFSRIEEVLVLIK